MIKDDETGLLVPEGDSQALADAIVRVLMHDRLAERLTNAALSLASESFSRSVVADSIVRLYDRVLSREGMQKEKSSA